MAKIALLIGISEYEDGLNPLPAAVKDVEKMQQVLLHPEIGGFAEADITILKNPARQDMETAIYELFTNRKKDDLLLFYFSGHGITDKVGQFYLATRSTRKDKANPNLVIDVTAVAASLLHQKMNNSRSEQQVVILDCCFSGAFAKGMTAKSDGAVNIQTQLGGKGRAVLASSTSTQYSFEHKQSGFSIYTHYLLEGMQEGKADGDSDGWISVDELHEYASDKVRKYCLENQIEPPMTPEIYAVKEGYKIHLAKAPIVDGKLIYFQEAKSRIVKGKFSTPALRILEFKRVSLGLSEDEAAAVRKELERPYREYEEALKEAINEEFPLSNATQKDLKDYQQILGLLDDDIREIERRVLTPKQAEYELFLKQREEQRQAEEKAARLKQQEEAEKRQQELARQKAEYELLVKQKEEQRQAEEKATRLKQQQEAEKQRQELEKTKQQRTVSASKNANTQPKIQAPSFEFEVATISIVKKPGFLGSGEKVSYEIQRSRKRTEFFTEDLGNGVKLEMIAIPGGKFLMGSPTDELGRYNSESPQHSVTIKPFFMGKFAVTQAQWQAVASFPKIKIDLKPEPSHFKGVNRPVEQINWYEAEEFCARLSQKTGRIYQLPSEAQWEYACRAGTTTPFHFGETITTDLANYCGKDETINGTLYKGSYANGPKGIYRQETTDVGSFPANPFGLYDIHGNVWEWCADDWHKNYEDAPNDETILLSSNINLERLLRGGSWYDYPQFCRSADRYSLVAGYSNSGFGFRVVCAAEWT